MSATATATLDDLLADWIANLSGEFVIAVEAEKFIASVPTSAVRSWLDEHAVAVMTQVIRDRLRSVRYQMARGAPARAFGDAVTAFEDGDAAPLRHFTVAYEVDEAHTWLTVGEMRGEHHRYVAASYEHSAQRGLALAAFHRAVAKKIDGRRTAEVLSEEQYERLLASILRRQ